MQEEMTAQCLSLIFKTLDWGGDTLFKALNTLLDELNKPHEGKANDFFAKESEPILSKGKQSAKGFVGKEAKKADINSTNIGGFASSARKYDIKMQLTQDDSTAPPTYTVLLEGKNMTDIKAALKDFVGKEEQKRGKPKQKSMNKELTDNKEKIKGKDKDLGGKAKGKSLNKPTKGEPSL